ncbi:hypothetical protein SDC9_128879 [bioreactor metagenome]|uniref:DUF6819 domain-containing protein n=1 Tax=bioreactor metagenome TaxID=1076179 RepID=A0A645CZ14_9ZZZZ
MIKGTEILRNIQQTSGETTGIYTYQNCNIKNSSLKKGIEFYNIAINKFLGNSLISRLKDNSYSNIEEVIAKLQPDTEKGSGEWIDLSGLIAPKNVIDTLLCEIEDNKHNLDQIQHEFEDMHKNYYQYEWTWALSKLLNRWNKKLTEVSYDDIFSMIELWKESVVKLDKLIYSDAKKEFDLNSKTGFGVDGNEEQKHQDFESVRGNFESNPFVLEVLNHIKIKTNLGDDLIEKLKLQ